MSKLFSPQAPTPTYVPPPPPGTDDASRKKQLEAQQQELAKAQGRASTYLTGGQGLTDTPATSRRSLIGF